MNQIFDILAGMAHDRVLLLVAAAIVTDTAFGTLRAIREHKLNSCVGIDGAIRKISMIISLVCLTVVDQIVSIDLIGFIPQEVRDYLGLGAIGCAGFFGLLYIAYEAVSILKNMALCGLPVKGIWLKVNSFLQTYTSELPDTEDADDTEKGQRHEDCEIISD